MDWTDDHRISKLMHEQYLGITVLVERSSELAKIRVGARNSEPVQDVFTLGHIHKP
jgi:hypothetical protein